ncbi:hypothetical protein HRW14_08720 [Streptomyces lunaelactis]|uniref:hypothetical protein n=1 Tax=Streptomyces lunaelactis TaxID=1535768 RepID=UPI0015856D82|nr:hypothetical protein [Streptomyces lunaelactis]NUK50371.1 hypothetical protein [Streptomyces lunaelactis]
MELHLTPEAVRTAVARMRDDANAWLDAFDSRLPPGVDLLQQLLQSMRAAELTLRLGSVYALREPVRPFPARYVGETMTPLSVRLSGHRSKRNLPVGRWIADLRRQGLEPVMEPLQLPGGVSAQRLKDVERHYIFDYIWQGHDLLNRSRAADEDAALYAWARRRSEHVHRYTPPTQYWDEVEQHWDWEDPGPSPRWAPLRHWRYRVRGAACPECDAGPGRPCLLNQSAESKRQGPANHLRRVAARSRYDEERARVA